MYLQYMFFYSKEKNALRLTAGVHSWGMTWVRVSELIVVAGVMVKLLWP